MISDHNDVERVVRVEEQDFRGYLCYNIVDGHVFIPADSGNTRKQNEFINLLNHVNK